MTKLHAQTELKRTKARQVGDQFPSSEAIDQGIQAGKKLQSAYVRACFVGVVRWAISFGVFYKTEDLKTEVAVDRH